MDLNNPSEQTDDRIFKYTYKATLGTYYLITLPLYIIVLFGFILWFKKSDIRGLIFALFYLISGILYALQIWFSNWVYIDAKKRALPEAGLWGFKIGGSMSKSIVKSILIPIIIYRYLKLRKSYPVINEIDTKPRPLWHHIVAIIIWLFFAIPVTLILTAP